MKMHRNRLGFVGACFLLIITQGCLRPGSQGSGLAVWFKNAAYIYELGSAGEKTPHKKTQTTQSRMTLNIEDWNGYYDHYMHAYQVFPGQDTIPTQEIVADTRHLLDPALQNIKDRMDARRHGGISFGGIYFKGALINFHFEGEIKDFTKAFGVMNEKEQTTVTLQQGVMSVDAPVPSWTRNSWIVTVVYPGKLIRSNAPEHDAEHKTLMWTDKTLKEKRIRFEVEAPKD